MPSAGGPPEIQLQRSIHEEQLLAILLIDV